MAKSTLREIIRTSDHASVAFEKAVANSERKMLDEVQLLIKDLETNPSGTIKTSIANLKRVQAIRTHLSKIANNKDYLRAVSELLREFDTIYNQQVSYYAVKNQSTRAEQKHALVKTIARENTIAALTGDGLAANVTAQLDKMLLRAVTSGARFADLQKELSDYLLTNEGGQGALSRYANTYAVTAISQYAGQHNKLFTDDLGTDWFEYVGSNIETSRPFCLACTKKRYIHRSEIHDLLAGHIHIVGGDDIDVEIYDKTGLPKGMIEGTTEENFQVNVGGWNCRHQLVPVAAEAVPENIRQEIKGNPQEKIQAEKQKSKPQNVAPKLTSVIQSAKQRGVDYIEVQPLSKTLPEADIIQRIGGGDLTKGSCSSLAFAYSANKCGFDVLDFRGGKSLDLFSKTYTIMSIAEKVGGIIEQHTNDYTKSVNLLKRVEIGKEYYFTCAEHVAIVRKTNTGYEYLELQSATENGWKPLTTNALKNRFGAKKSHSLYGTKLETRECLIDIDLFKQSGDFKELLAYINTKEDKQQNGTRGTIK